MGLFGKKNKNKEKGVPFWRRNKQQAEKETVLEPEEQTAETADAEAEEDIAAAALNDLAAQEQDEIEKARLAAQEVVEESEQHQAAIALARQAALEAAGILKNEEKAEPEEETEPEEEAEPEKETEPEAEEPEEVEPVEEPEQEAETESETEPAEAVEPESEEAAEPETELTEESEPEAEIESEGESQSEEAEPEKKKGFFAKIRDGLRKTKDAMVSRMQQVLGGFTKIDDDLFDELEETMITSDLGPETSVQICETLRKRVKERGVKDPQEIMGMIQEIIGEMLGEDQTLEYPTQPTIVMVIGVNGAGKTTTIGKLCHQLKGEGKKVLVAAADTFRAAAIDQLEVWTQRAGVDIVKHAEGSDPASVVYDAIDAAKARGCDVLICDTAGRLHNKQNLMNELAKLRKIIDRECPNSNCETLLVLDATTGQNGLIQARTFKETAGLTGIILTKLDGTAKGGIVIAIAQELGVPVKFVGVGEGIDDLKPFDPTAFVQDMI